MSDSKGESKGKIQHDLEDPLLDSSPTARAEDVEHLSASTRYPGLYKGLGIFSEGCKWIGAGLVVTGFGTEMWEVAQKTKKSYNEGYDNGFSKGLSDAEEDVINLPPMSQLQGAKFGFGTLAQGLINYTAIPIAFWGAKKLATAKNWQDILKGIGCIGTGVSCIMLNSTIVFAANALETNGYAFGYMDGHNEHLGEGPRYGKKTIYMPAMLEGYNSLVVCIGAVSTGFLSGVADRLRSNMEQQSNNVQTSPAPLPINNV